MICPHCHQKVKMSSANRQKVKGTYEHKVCPVMREYYRKKAKAEKSQK